MSRFDAIIIGGGHNGLAAAITLGKRGRTVLVLEARAQLGGLCAPRTFHPGFTAPGVFHDTDLVRAPLLDALSLTRHGLSLRDAEVPVHAPASGGEGLLLYADPERCELSARDAAGYRELCRLVDRARGPLSALLDAAPPPLVPAGLGDLLGVAQLGLRLRALGASELYGLVRVGPMCIADLTRDHLESELLQAALAGPAVRSEYAGPWSPGTAARWVLHRAAAGREIDGGPAALVRALERSLLATGGQSRTGARVTQIMLDAAPGSAAAVAGVRLESGEELRAPLVGVSVAPRRLLQLLPPRALPLKVTQALSQVRARGTAAKVHLALRAPIETAAGHFERLRLADSLEELERAFDAVKYRQLSPAPALDVRQPSLADASLAPGGAAVASIWVSFAPHHVEGGWTPARRQQLLEAVLARLARYDRHVRAKLVASEVLDPSVLEAEYGLPEGNVHHAEMTLDQLLFMRPTPHLAHYRTPVRGLFLCGSGSHPGGGVTLAPGALAARAALEAT